MNIKIPEKINTVLQILEDAGFDAFIVGGCVRDMILGKIPDDFDVTTNALPDTVVSLFKHTVCTGIRHGTVTVIIDGCPIEVTTYRTEYGYSDSRHPDGVQFVSNINDDLARRDFTVNAVCYNPNVGIVDPFGGIADIESRILRAVGDPETRFREDALRIMRLFRFSASLDFEIEKNTFENALRFAATLEAVSRERISTELRKTVCAENAQAIYPLIKSGNLSFLGIADCRSLDRLGMLDPNEYLRFFAFLSLCKCDMKQVLNELKCSNAMKEYCATAARLCTMPLESKVDIKYALNRSSQEAVDNILQFKRIVLKEDTHRQEKILNEIIKNGEPYKISHLDIKGEDLMNMGISGSNIGITLERLLDFVIQSPEENRCDILMKKIK